MIWLSKNWLIIAAAVSALVTLSLAAFDKTSSSAVTAGFTLALVVMQNFPLLESLKGWGVEAKMRAEKVEKDLHKAEAILKRMDKIALTVSSASLGWMYYAGRIESPRWSEKAELIRSIQHLYGDGVLPSSISLGIAKTMHLQSSLLAAHVQAVVNMRASKLQIATRPNCDDAMVFCGETDFENSIRDFIDKSGLPHDDSIKLEGYVPQAVEGYRKIRALDGSARNVEFEDRETIYVEIFGEAPPDRSPLF